MPLEGDVSQLRAELEKANSAHRRDPTEANLRRVNEVHDVAAEFVYRWRKYSRTSVYQQ